MLLQSGGFLYPPYVYFSAPKNETTLFVIELSTSKKTTKCSLEEPVFLVLDNHSSHVYLSAYNFCKSNGIVMVSFPPHTYLKKAINGEIDLYLKNHKYKK